MRLSLHLGRRDEPGVDTTLAALERDGWSAMSRLQTEGGLVDHIVSGPGGAYALHVRSQPGPGDGAHAPRAWLEEAAEQARWASAWFGVSLTPVLVLANADLGVRGWVVRDGVVVVSALRLPAFLRAAARGGGRLPPSGGERFVIAA